MTNEPLLQQWENIVERENIVEKENMSPWKATISSRICSTHFERTDYIIPPSSSIPCRLKPNAIPSRFPLHEFEGPSAALQSWLEFPSKRPLSSVDNTMSPPAKAASKDDERDALEKKLRDKIKSLQQQLRRSKQKIQSMSEVIESLTEKLNLNESDSVLLQSTVDNMGMKLLLNMKENLNTIPSAQRYSDEIKEFALTVYFYSPRAYRYIRSIIPLPNPSLVRKWSASLQCEPGFIKEAFASLTQEVTNSPTKKDCCLVLDAMAIRSQTVWTPQRDKYFGFVDYGTGIPNPPSDQLASEALVFLLVGTRSHWKCPIGYFLGNKTNAEIQSKLVSKALELAAEAGLKVWSVTADGTAVNVKTFELLGCKFVANYDDMVTSFKHPTTGEEVFAIVDPCHMLKLARNALEAYGSFVDLLNKIKWQHIKELQKLQENEGLALGNKLSSQHVEFQKHKMNVRLAAQTLSSSVANAIEFLDESFKLPAFQNSNGTVEFFKNNRQTI